MNIWLLANSFQFLLIFLGKSQSKLKKSFNSSTSLLRSSNSFWKYKYSRSSSGLRLLSFVLSKNSVIVILYSLELSFEYKNLLFLLEITEYVFVWSNLARKKFEVHF